MSRPFTCAACGRRFLRSHNENLDPQEKWREAMIDRGCH